MKLIKKSTFQKDGKWYRVKSTFGDLVNCVELKPNTMRAKMGAYSVQFNFADIKQNIIDQLNVELEASGKKINGLVKEILEPFKTKYYRLWDNQTGRHMATGYNAHGIDDLAEQYLLYVSVNLEYDGVELKDVPEEDKHAWYGEKKFIDIFSTGTDEASIRSYITGAGFSVEESDTPFCKECDSENTEVYFDADSGSPNSMVRCRDCKHEEVLA